MLPDFVTLSSSLVTNPYAHPTFLRPFHYLYQKSHSLMDFLHSVARLFVRQLSPDRWPDTIFVFPNHRSSVFFADALSSQLAVLKRANKPHVIFGLHTTTLADLLLQGSNLHIADPLTLRCELYDVYKSLLPDDAQPLKFESFYSWASIILNDFQDIDLSLANPAAIYRNVSDWQSLSDDLSYISDRQRQAIESFWNVEFTDAVSPTGQPLKVHRRFVESYGRMEQLYSTFQARLRLKGLAYPAMLLRDAALSANNNTWDTPSKSYVFIGFSLLSKAEDTIFSRLQSAHRAQFFWDYQDWMLSPAEGDNIHGAGYAVAQWVKKYPAPFAYHPPRQVSPNSQDIRLIKVTYPHAQANVVASNILQSVTNPDTAPDARLASARRDFKRTAIVLPDEQMLLPVLSVIPTDIVSNINVTMGYGLKYSNIYSLASLIANLHNGLNCRLRAGIPHFNTKAIIPILRHPYVSAVDGLEPSRQVINKILSQNIVFLAPSDPLLTSLPLASQIVQKLAPDSVVPYITTIFEQILAHFATIEKATLDREAIWEALKVTRKLASIIPLVINDILSPNMLLFILCSMIEQQKVDFKGMPLGGLQIMGILETRAVDFDDVTILDIVEDKWPRRSPSIESMIPRIIRRGNSMPTSDERDATYHYYFYRLLSRAKHVTLIRPLYESASTNRPTQLSRYVLQLQMLRNRAIQHLSAQRDVHIRQDAPIQVNKADVLHLMDDIKLSPTAISTYILCPLQFFFQRVARLNIDDELAEDAEMRHLGIIFHAVMEHLYKCPPNSPGKLLTSQYLKSILDNPQALDSLIINEFANAMNNPHLKTVDDLSGRNILSFRVVRNFIINAINSEIPNTLVTNTEQKITLNITLPSGRIVPLQGTIDRQHRLPNSPLLHVVDYKTGNVKLPINISTLNDLFDQNSHKKNKPVTQTLIYCYLLRHALNIHEPLAPSIFAMSTLHQEDGGRKDRAPQIKTGPGKSAPTTPIIYSDTLANDFDNLLLNTISQIFDPSVPFTQAPDTSNSPCRNCQYTHICHRHPSKY